MGHVLAIDQGTTSTRAIVFDEAGRPGVSAVRPLQQIFPEPGWVEHDPREIWRAVCEVAQAVVVAPVQYSLLIWGTFYGFLLFAEFPDFWTLFGAAIIVATGVYTFHREFQLSRSGRA